MLQTYVPKFQTKNENILIDQIKHASKQNDCTAESELTAKWPIVLSINEKLLLNSF